jgi:hypothetical protein
MTNHMGKTETLTLTVPCKTATESDTQGSVNTQVISGVLTTNDAGSVIVSSMTSDVVFSSITKTNGNIETITVTVTCGKTTIYTSVGRADTTTTAAVSYFPTVDIHGSVITAETTITGKTTSGKSIVSEATSTVIYTSNGVIQTGVVVFETTTNALGISVGLLLDLQLLCQHYPHPAL